VQFMPAVVLPQLLLCGLFAPRAQMAGVLRVISDALPLTYAFDALARVSSGHAGARLWLDVAVVTVAMTLALVLGAATLRRRSA
jgi:ABC-2 type transport system permease protein